MTEKQENLINLINTYNIRFIHNGIFIRDSVFLRYESDGSLHSMLEPGIVNAEFLIEIGNWPGNEKIKAYKLSYLGYDYNFSDLKEFSNFQKYKNDQSLQKDKDDFDDFLRE